MGFRRVEGFAQFPQGAAEHDQPDDANQDANQPHQQHKNAGNSRQIVSNRRIRIRLERGQLMQLFADGGQPTGDFVQQGRIVQLKRVSTARSAHCQR